MVATVTSITVAAAAVLGLSRRPISAWVTRHRTIRPGVWLIGERDEGP